MTSKQLTESLLHTADPHGTTIHALESYQFEGGREGLYEAIDAGYFKRKFAIDGGYPHPRTAVDAFLNSHYSDPADYIGNGPGAALVGQIAMNQWAKYGTPIYMIDPELAKALSRTNIPKDMMTHELMLPFPTFMLGFKDGSMVVVTGFDDATMGGGKALVVRSPLFKGQIAMSFIGDGRKLVDIEGVDASVPEDVANMSISIAHLAVTVTMFLNSRAEYHTNHTDRVRKASRDKLEMVKPRIVGANYKIRCVSEGGHSDSGAGGKIEHHWRCGHMRLQWHGKGRTLSKTMWIEPYEVNPP